MIPKRLDFESNTTTNLVVATVDKLALSVDKASHIVKYLCRNGSGTYRKYGCAGPAGGTSRHTYPTVGRVSLQLQGKSCAGNCAAHRGTPSHRCHVPRVPLYQRAHVRHTGTSATNICSIMRSWEDER